MVVPAGSPSAWKTTERAAVAGGGRDPAGRGGRRGSARGEDAEGSEQDDRGEATARRHRPNFSKAKIVGSTVTPEEASFSRNLGRRPVDFRVPSERPASSKPAL